ncbi:TPA: O-antigen polymerase [Klebsiella quasipneumoniae]
MNTKNSNEFLASPFFIVTLSYVLFIIILFIPPDYYAKIIGERNFLFFDSKSFVFFSLNVISFCVGCLSFNIFKSEFSKNSELRIGYEKRIPVNIFGYVLYPVVFFLLASLFSIYLLIEKNKALIYLMFIGDVNAQYYKSEMDSTYTFEPLGQIANVVTLWAVYHYLFFKDKLTKSKRYTLLLFIVFIFLVCVFRAFVKIARYEMMPLIFGFIVIYIHYKYQTRSTTQILKYYTLFIFLIVIIFSTFSFFRKDGNIDDIIKDLLGYTMVSYNHMAALLAGHLKLFNPGDGYYLFSFISSIPFAGDSFSSSLGWASKDVIYLRSFQDTFQSGLNGYYVWVSCFGDLYQSIGYFSVIYLFLNGFAMMWSWCKFRAGSLSGIILYPWFFFCVFFWFGVNMVLTRWGFYTLLTLAFFSCYDLFYRKKR